MWTPRPALADDPSAQAAQDDLAAFVQQAWGVLEPDTPYLDNWHIGYLCEYLSAVTAGEISRLVINMPPRYMKSTIVTICWPAWWWLKKPSLRWIFASYANPLALYLSVLRRMLIQSDWYQARWGDRFALTSDQNVKGEYRNNRQGHMLSVGIGDTVTGKGADVEVIDDPHDPLTVESANTRQVARDFYQRKLYQRLNDKAKGPIVCVMQRTHQEDLTGLLVDQGFEQVKLPMVAETRAVHTFPVSGTDHTREVGDVLWPERDSAATIEQIKTSVGPYVWAGQNQQEPSPAGGGLFPRHWWRFWHYPDAPLPAYPLKDADGQVMSCACTPLPAHKDKDGAWVLDVDEIAQDWDTGLNSDIASRDYVVGLVSARRGPYRYLLDLSRDRRTLPETIEAVADLSARWPKAGYKWIEGKANGPAVMRALRTRLTGMQATQPDGAKEQRAQAATPPIASGHVLVPHPQIAPWVLGFIEECAQFPHGKNDDQVDVLTQMINRWSRGGGWS